MMQAEGLQLTIIDIDEDALPVLHVEIRVWNVRYCATTTVWIPASAFTDVAAAIEGFPQRLSDERVVELGHRDGEIASGGMLWVRGFCRLHFRYGVDHSCPEIQVYVEDDRSETSLTLSLTFEPAALDRFVTALRVLSGQVAVGSDAMLDGASV